MAARSTLTVTSGTTITSSWGNSVRDHVVSRTTSNDVAAAGQIGFNTTSGIGYTHNGAVAVEFARYTGWTDFTATVTQSFGVAYTATYRGFKRDGFEVTANVVMTFTGNGSSGNTIVVATDLPAPPTTLHCGTFSYVDAATAMYVGTVLIDTSSNLTFYVHNNALAALGASPSFAIVSTDVLRFELDYPAAAV